MNKWSSSLDINDERINELERGSKEIIYISAQIHKEELHYGEKTVRRLVIQLNRDLEGNTDKAIFKKIIAEYFPEILKEPIYSLFLF